MTQIQIKTIDPQVLAMKVKEEELGLDDIGLFLNSIKLPIKLVEKILQGIVMIAFFKMDLVVKFIYLYKGYWKKIDEIGFF